MMRKYSHAELQSKDVTAENLDAMKGLFPQAFREGRIDFDVLRQCLGDHVDEGEERYGLFWHGKRAARQLALTPSTGTLRPAKGESVDWDSTKNVFIEGDNLEVLKLLQRSYAGKIKLIYIDPPYNTGKDFIYPDDYRDSIGNYHAITKQMVDGLRVASNRESGGRFHTEWLSMMAPRLQLARDLLAPDGSIWISIDDNELSNMGSICDEIFGHTNFVANFIWQKRSTRENRKVFSVSHDYVMCYASNSTLFQTKRNLLPLSEEVLARYSNRDDDPRGVWQDVPLDAQAGHATAAQFYEVTTPGGRVVAPSAGRCWVVDRARMNELIADKRVWFGESGNNVPREKVFITEAKDGLTPHTLWLASEVGTNDSAKKAIIRLFDGEGVYDTPKPVELLRRIVQIATSSGDDLVLDFFAGSGTTAQAVSEQNAEDGGKRRYVLLPVARAGNQR